MSSPANDTSTMQRQLDELRHEVAQLRDREAIRTVLDNYAFLLDTARWRDIAKAVFTEDAIDHHSPAMGPGAVPRGREEIDRFLDTTMRAFAGSQHMLGNSSITVDGDTARSRTYAACAHWRPSEPSDPNERIDPSDPSATPPRPSDLTVRAVGAHVRPPRHTRRKPVSRLAQIGFGPLRFAGPLTDEARRPSLPDSTTHRSIVVSEPPRTPVEADLARNRRAPQRRPLDATVPRSGSAPGRSRAGG
jgi:hypothetical protein